MNKYLVDIATFPSDARRAWHTDGSRGLWEEVAERTVYRLVRRGHYDLYERDLSTIARIPAPDGLEIRMLAPDEHARLDKLMTRRRRAQLDRNPADRTVFVALRAGIVVAYSWWTPTFDSALDFAPLVVPPDGIFHGFVHVERAERHRGTANALFVAGEGYFHDRGTRVCWFLIKSTNVLGARAARGRWGRQSRHVARLSYSRTPFDTTRTLALVEPA